MKISEFIKKKPHPHKDYILKNKEYLIERFKKEHNCVCCRMVASWWTISCCKTNFYCTKCKDEIIRQRPFMKGMFKKYEH